ncbi:acyl-CoA dehydrogenase family protein [Actinoplanes sp. NPDC020271]|uniref:acyl-CoA dehydrogenase family protein n=1 Tax=Actinoplanes sp. NPDC020271 TaxID=3363896 RepID=UPI0037B931A9
MRRRIFDADHEAFRDSVRAFLRAELVPHLPKWEADGQVGRDVWRRAGEAGLLGICVPEEFGGGGSSDVRYVFVRDEELARVGTLSPAFNLHSEVVGGSINRLGTPEQRKRWLPGICQGTVIGAMAVSEPGAGSDVAAIATVARRDGAGYVLSGQKSYVTHALLADIVVVLARLEDTPGRKRTGPPRGVLLVVDLDAPGVHRGRAERTIGVHALDTVEVTFDDVVVPADRLLGEEGLGFVHLSETMLHERFSIAVTSLALAERVFADTVEHCHTRHAFGGPLSALQHVRFTLAEMATELRVARAFTDTCIEQFVNGEIAPEEVAMAKLWNTELCGRITDRCLQLHGGVGYSADGIVGRAFVDCRVERIYGGSSEVMKEIIGQSV